MNKKTTELLYWGVFAGWALVGTSIIYFFNIVAGMAWFISPLLFPQLKEVKINTQGRAPEIEIIDPNEKE